MSDTDKANKNGRHIHIFLYVQYVCMYAVDNSNHDCSVEKLLQRNEVDTYEPQRPMGSYNRPLVARLIKLIFVQHFQ